MSTSSSAPPYALLYGAYYFGTIISTAFYGITCMQTFVLSSVSASVIHYQSDVQRTKIFVAIVWVLNTVHEALVIVATYKYTMTGLQIPDSYLTANPEMILHILPTALVTLCIRGYFVYRIYLFVGRRTVVPLIWVVPASVEFVTSILYITYALPTVNGEVQAVGLGALGVNPFLTVGTINLSVSAGVDILIAICMTILLFRKRSRTRFASTVHLLQRLTVFAVNTGIWPASLALLTIILLHVFPTNIVNYLPYIPLCSVYCNTLLANLNARAYIAAREATQVIDMDLFSVSVSQGSESTAVVGHHQALRFASLAKEEESSVTEGVPALDSISPQVI